MFCLNPNSYDGKILIERLGEKAAYHVNHLNNGHNLEYAPNGRRSMLFDGIIDYTGDYDRAIELKSRFYTKGFRDKYGDWLGNGSKLNKDVNGEPLLSDYIHILGNQVVAEAEPMRQVASDVRTPTEVARETYSPILNKLAESFNIPWQEDKNLDSAGAYVDGKVIVNFENITPDAPFHEYAHPIVLMIKNHDPSSYNRLVAEAQRYPDIVKEVKDSSPGLSRSELNDELVTHVIGLMAARDKSVTERKGIMSAIKHFLEAVARWFNDVLSPGRQLTREDISKMTLREIGFMMGTTTTRVDIGQIQQLYDKIKEEGKQMKRYGMDSVQVKVRDYEIVQGYRSVFGSWNVDVVKNPEENEGDYLVNIYNPIGTGGRKLLRTKAEAKKDDKPKYDHTAEPFIDELIKVLDDKISSLFSQISGKLPTAKRKNVSQNINYYRDLVDQFYSNATLELGVGVISTEMRKLERSVDKELNVGEIKSAIKMLNGFSTIDTYVNKFNRAGALLDNVEKIISSISALRARYQAKLLEQTKKEMIEEGAPESVANRMGENIDDIGEGSLQAIGSGFSRAATEQAGDWLIHRKAYQANEKSRMFEQELDRRVAKFNDNVDFLFDSKGELISRVNKEFIVKIRELRKQIAETTERTWEIRKENKEMERQLNVLLARPVPPVAELNALHAKMKLKQEEEQKIKAQGKSWNDYHRFMQQHFDYVLTEEKQKEWEEFKSEEASNFIKVNSYGKEVIDHDGWKRSLARNDPEQFKQYLAGTIKYPPKEASRWFTLVPKEGTLKKLYSSEYKAMSKEQKEFYDFFTDKFYEATVSIHNKPLYNNEDLNIDSAMSDFINMPDEKVREKMKYSTAVKEWLTDSLSVNEDLPDSGVQGVYSKRTNKQMKFKYVGEFINHKKDLKKQDVIKIMKKYYAAGIAYEYKKSAEDLLNATSEITFLANKLSKKNSGENKKDMFGKEKTTPETSKTYDRLRHITDDYLYGAASVKGEDGVVTAFGKKLSVSKMADLLTDFTRLRQMGLNPLSGLSNLIMGTANNWTYAKREEFFSEGDLRRAYAKMGGNAFHSITGGLADGGAEAEKIRLLAEKFGVNSHNTMESTNLASQVMKKAFVFQEHGEFINHMAVVIATLSSGKLGEIRDRAGAVRSMYDVFKVKDKAIVLDAENFDLDKLGIDEKRIFNIVQGISKVNKEIHGDYDPLNKMYAKRSTIGRMLATFRTWLPQAIMQRFGSERVDVQLSEMMGKEVIREGRYVSLYKALGKKGAANIVFSLAKGMIPFVDGRIKPTETMNDTHVANINQTLSEVRLLLLLLILIRLMGKMKDDDEPEEEQTVYNFFYNLTTRTENELSFFYYPTNGTKFFKDIIPALDSVNQTFKTLGAGVNKVIDSEHDIYQRGFRKGTSKFWKELQILTPGFKQIQNVWSVVSQQYNSNAYTKK